MGRYGQFDGQISNYKKSQGELLISQGYSQNHLLVLRGECRPEDIKGSGIRVD